MPPARPIPMGSGTANMSMTSISSVWRGLFITGMSVFDLCRCMWGARVHGIIAMSTTSSFLRCHTHMIPFPILAAVDKPGKRRAPASERDPRAARAGRRTPVTWLGAAGEPAREGSCSSSSCARHVGQEHAPDVSSAPVPRPTRSIPTNKHIPSLSP